jgi:hypothetical protein
MLVTLLPIVRFVNLKQVMNASLPMLMTLSGIVTLDKLVAPKASFPMLVTLLGIRQLVKVWQL